MLTETMRIIALLFGLVATILAFVFIVPSSKREGLPKVGQILHDIFNFKYLVIEKILQFMYIFSTAVVVIAGFTMLFYVQENINYYTGKVTSVWYGGYGILVMLVGPILVRLAYEAIMMALLLVKNVIQINDKMKDSSEPAQDNAAQEAPAAPVTPLCPDCGADVTGMTFCNICGRKVK